MTKTKILYDGNCIVCDIEISHYKRIAPDLFELIDISSPRFVASDYKLTKKEVDKDMHLITQDGELKIGVDAFVHIWSRLNKFKILAKCVKLPGIYQCAKLGYSAFTLVRPYLPKKRR